MKIITLEEIRTIYGRRKREMVFKEYLSKLLEALEARMLDDGSYSVDGDGEICWHMLQSIQSPEEAQRIITGLKWISDITKTIARMNKNENN